MSGEIRSEEGEISSEEGEISSEEGEISSEERIISDMSVLTEEPQARGGQSGDGCASTLDSLNPM